MRRMPPHAARLLWIGALLGSLSVQAQATGTVSAARGENNGIRFGPGRLHPYLDLELRYDSAALYAPTDPANLNSPLELRPELLMHFRPGFRFDVPGTDIAFGLNAFYDYVWYTGALTSGSSSASRSEAGAEMHGEFNREGAVEVQIGDSFSRSDRPRDIGLGIAVVSLYNQVRLAVPIHPGGRAFDVRPHGEYAVELFGQYSGAPATIGQCSPGTNCTQPSDSNYQQYSGGLDLHWKFLPQTALLFESSYVGRSYFNSSPNNVPPGSLLKLQTGLAGLVTPRIQVVLKIGYAIGFSGATSTLIGQAEGTWTPTETSALTLGILRDAMPTVGAASATDLRPYLNAKTFLIGRLGLHLNLAYDIINFTQGRGQTDQLFSIDTGLDFAITRWLITSAGYVFSKRSSDYATSLPLNYSRNEAYLRLTFTY